MFIKKGFIISIVILYNQMISIFYVYQYICSSFNYKTASLFLLNLDIYHFKSFSWCAFQICFWFYFSNAIRE